MRQRNVYLSCWLQHCKSRKLCPPTTKHICTSPTCLSCYRQWVVLCIVCLFFLVSSLHCWFIWTIWLGKKTYNGELIKCEFTVHVFVWLCLLCVLGTCVCGECNCYDVDPSGDWGDIHGDTCECDERNCHATYDRYTDDFCSGQHGVFGLKKIQSHTCISPQEWAFVYFPKC